MVSEGSCSKEQRTSLLIACTERIFTALAGEYRRILRVSSIQPNAHLTITDEGGSVSYLRTVLAVTSILDAAFWPFMSP
mgnify:CR=1 FL=1